MKNKLLYFLFGLASGIAGILLYDKYFSYRSVRTYYRPSYTSYYSSYYKRNKSNISKYRVSGRRPQDVDFDSYADAQDVLDKCREYIDEYGKCTINDFYEFTGEENPNPMYIDQSYGWELYDLKDVKVTKRLFGNKYYINFPEACYLG